MKKLIILSMILTLLTIPVSAISQKGFDPNSIKVEGLLPYFNSHAFQSGIQTEKNLGEIARQNSPLAEKVTAFGFAAKSDEARFFLIGALYTEVLAYLHGGKMDLASQRLELIEREFINIGAPSSLYNFITKTRNLVDNGKYPSEYLITVASLFQPFFEEYAKSKSEDKLTLFRAGSWLVNMSLTAAGNDKELLRQSATLAYFSNELKRMDAPKGVLEALGEISKISRKENITDKDSEKVLQLVKEIEQLLS